MGIKSENNLVHWNYYLALEQDLIKVSRFVEFDEDNFECYSIELAHLLIASASEIDVVLKALCNNISGKTHKTINHYRDTIKENLSDLITEKVYASRYGLQLTPWINWQKEDLNPLWWKSYNNVKHQRDKHFKEANLKNVLNTVAALQLVIIYFYKDQFEKQQGGTLNMWDVTENLNPESALLKCNDDYYYHHLMHR